MVFQIIFLVVILVMATWEYFLAKRIDGLTDALANLANGFTELQKWTVNRFKDYDSENELIEKRISGVEEKVDDLPIEKFKETVEQEANFMDGLNNILNFNISNYGLNNGGVKHE